MAAMENSRMKLSYFDARGVAETTRYMLAVTKTPYEDFRYGLNFGTPGDFSTVQRPEFDAAKAAGAFAITTPIDVRARLRSRAS